MATFFARRCITLVLYYMNVIRTIESNRWFKSVVPGLAEEPIRFPLAVRSFLEMLGPFLGRPDVESIKGSRCSE